MAWLQANWQTVLLVILSIDSVLIPIFPDVGVLVKIRDILSIFKPKPPTV